MTRMFPWLIMIAAAFVAPQDSAPARSIAWREGLAEARAEATKEGRPLFVVFRCEA